MLGLMFGKIDIPMTTINKILEVSKLQILCDPAPNINWCKLHIVRCRRGLLSNQFKKNMRYGLWKTVSKHLKVIKPSVQTHSWKKKKKKKRDFLCGKAELLKLREHKY